jgi:hypothetical protein
MLLNKRGIPIQSFKSKKSGLNKSYIEDRRIITLKELKRFKKWLVDFKGYKINNISIYRISYQETPNSPEIKVRRNESKNQSIIDVLGNHHFDEFKNKSYAVDKSCRDVGDFYRSYITSQEWRDRSLKCLADADHQCEVCGNSDELNTHHYNYHNLAKESENDLFCLCKRCHGLYHKKYPASELPSDYDLPRLTRLHHIMGTILQMMKRV